MTVEERLAAMEQRLRQVEDELAISRLLASYGPLVDAGDGDGDAVAALWAEDGEYDVDDSEQARELLAAGALGRPA